MNNTNIEMYTTSQAAKLLGVTPMTICVWCDKNLLKCTKTLGGHRKISKEEIDRALQKQNNS